MRLCWVSLGLAQAENSSRCELSSLVFGSLAALTLAANTAVIWPREQERVIVSVYAESLYIYTNEPNNKHTTLLLNSYRFTVLAVVSKYNLIPLACKLLYVKNHCFIFLNFESLPLLCKSLAVLSSFTLANIEARQLGLPSLHFFTAELGNLREPIVLYVV